MSFAAAKWFASLAETCEHVEHQLVYVTTLGTTNVFAVD
jgi:hypothetical protein